MKILLVEDDASMRRAISRLLKAAGFESMEFESVEALLQSDQIASADCVVSDNHLPGMTGLDLVDTLRQRHSHLPSILITAFDAPGLREEALNRGAAAYLTKPFEGTMLLDTIRRINIRAVPN